MKTFSNAIIRYRWLIIFGFLAITVFFAIQLPKTQLNPDMMTYMPEDMPSMVQKKKIEELFGGIEMVMVLVKTDDVLKADTLKRVKKISKKVKRLKGIDKTMSLFELKNIKGEDGAMIVDPAVKRIPKTAEAREILRNELKDNELVYGNVVSEDFTVTAIIGTVEPGTSDKTLIGDIEKIIAKYPGEEEVIIGGTPFSKLNVAKNTSKDTALLMPIGLLIMLFFLYFCFRQMRGVLLPFLVVVMSIIVALGLMPLLGWKFTAITVVLPVMLIAVANDYGIHMITKYQEDNRPGNRLTKNEMAKRMFSSLMKPIVLTGITTMVGMLCLQGHIMIPAEEMGVLAAVGIAFALAASLMFIPAMISLLPNAKPVQTANTENDKSPLLERIMYAFGNLISRKPKGVILVSLVFTALITSGIYFLKVNTDPVSYFTKDHPVQYSAGLINKKLGGLFPVSVVFKGDIKNPRLLKAIDRIEKQIADMDEIGSTMSIAKVVRQMSRVINDNNDPGYDQIPDTYNAVAQYFELYMMSGEPDDLEKMVDFSFEHAVITARVSSASTPVLRKVVGEINQLVADTPEVLYVNGMAAVFSELDVNMVRGQFISLALALVSVTLLMMVVFRSVTAGLISSIPLVLSVMILFGLMGLLNIELNMATALLTSIMIGVGIDYTIHFLWRYKEERKNGRTYSEATKQTLVTTGRGIVFNAFSVIIGFLALMFSSFVPVRFFGFLVVVSIFACLLGALIVIPSLCIVFKPRFLEPKAATLTETALTKATCLF